MKKILISHETPIKLLQHSLFYNDYDYCLVHLLEQVKEYAAFYYKSVKSGRNVLLDNSLFELKKAFDAKSFAKHIDKLCPYEYIVPDVYEDSDATIDNFKNWMKTYSNLPGRTIGVVQGKTFNDFINCYKFMSDHANKIALSFDNSYLLATGHCQPIIYTHEGVVS